MLDSRHSEFCSKQSGPIEECAVCSAIKKMMEKRELELKPKEVDVLRERFMHIKEERSALLKEQDKVLQEMQSKCDHSGTLYLCERFSHGPRRMCSLCGYEEDTWESSFKSKLPSEYNKEVRLRTVTLDYRTFFHKRF